MKRRVPYGVQGQNGQGLVEFALVLPIILVLVVSVAELGFIYGNVQSLGYASREGARAGSALARGNAADCVAPQVGQDPTDPSGVDPTAVAAVQRILKSPDSGIELDKIEEILIFKALGSGAPDPAEINRWTRPGPTALVDPDEPDVNLAVIGFTERARPWPACDRFNGSPNPDSIGVTVTYRYDFVTPLPALVNAISGGDFFLTLSETTVMALNPTF